MSVMGFQKKTLDRRVGGLGEIYSGFFFEFCNLAKPLRVFAEVH